MAADHDHERQLEDLRLEIRDLKERLDKYRNGDPEPQMWCDDEDRSPHWLIAARAAYPSGTRGFTSWSRVYTACAEHALERRDRPMRLFLLVSEGGYADGDYGLVRAESKAKALEVLHERGHVGFTEDDLVEVDVDEEPDVVWYMHITNSAGDE